MFWVRGATDTVTLVGSGLGTEAAKWRGAVAVGDYVYGTPFRAETVLKFDTTDDSHTTFGSFGTTDAKWGDGIRAPNGKIYCVPGRVNSILVIDPSDDSTYEIDTGTEDTTNIRYYGAVRVGNYIYGVPYAATEVIKIDTTDDSYTTFGSLALLTSKWTDGAVVGGVIYCVPFNATEFLKIDTATDTATTFGTAPGSNAWLGAVARDGYVYGAPYMATGVLRIDPSDDSTTTFGSFSSTLPKWQSGVLANGRIYLAPGFEGDRVLRIDAGDIAQRIDPGVGTGTAAQWSSIGVATNGAIYALPGRAENVLRIVPAP